MLLRRRHRARGESFRSLSERGRSCGRPGRCAAGGGQVAAAADELQAGREGVAKLGAGRRARGARRGGQAARGAHSPPLSALRGARGSARCRRRRSPLAATCAVRPRADSRQPTRRRHGLLRPRLHRGEDLHIHQHCVRDVQRRAAGDGRAAGLGPQHVRVVPVHVRGAVPRVGRLRGGRRRLAGGARLPGRRRRRLGRHARRAQPPARPLPAPLLRGRGVPGAERGVLRRVAGLVAGGVVARLPARRAGAPRPRPAARHQAGAARHGAVPGRRAPALRHDRGSGARSAQ